LTLSRDAVEHNCILVPRDDSTTDMEVFPMHTPAPIELMNVCLLRDGANRMLVQDRTDPSWPVLCFPGGHVEIGETCADAVIREMQEETGLTVVSPRLVGIKEWMKHGGQTRGVQMLPRPVDVVGKDKQRGVGVFVPDRCDSAGVVVRRADL